MTLSEQLRAAALYLKMELTNAPLDTSVFVQQIDRLLVEEEWNPLDRLPDFRSFHTVLNFIMKTSVSHPSLSLDDSGYFVMSWLGDNSIIHIYAYPNDLVRAMGVFDGKPFKTPTLSITEPRELDITSDYLALCVDIEK